MKHYFILILLAALGFTSCESDTPSSSTNSGKKELEILPVSITTERFVEFKVKARMTNIPQSDVRIEYDWGDGKSDGKTPYTIEAGYPYPHTYTDTGSYTITVRAYDDFTDELLATKTIPAQVNELPHIVEFPVASMDTTMECDMYGNLPYIYYYVTTNAPYPKFTWNLGDGTPDTTTSSNSFAIYFPTSGTHIVRVDVYDYKGTYWGSDTLIATISQPNVSATILQNTKHVTVCYAPDESSPIYSTVSKLTTRLEAGLFVHGDSTTSSWYGSTFDLRYKVHFPDSSRGLRADYHISGKVSSDFQSIDEVTVMMFDSNLAASAGKNRSLHGYRLSGLKLAGVNKDMIIYRVIGKPSFEFASNEYFAMQFISSTVFGFPNGNIIYYLTEYQQQRKPPYGYVIFTR